MRSRPPDVTSVGYRDLLADLDHPGCPACRGSGRSAWQFLDALLWEFVNDPGVRRALRSAHGLCREHAMMSLDVAREQAAAAGIAALSVDFLGHVRGELIHAVGDPRGWRRWKAESALRGVEPHRSCPACDSAEGVADTYLRIIASSDETSAVGTAARRSQRTPCLPHVLRGLRLARDRKGARRLLEVYIRGEEELCGDLEEFIRKQSHTYRHEPLLRGERDSWIRAVALLVGSPLPRRKPER